MRIPEQYHDGRYHEIKEHGGREFPFNIYPCSIPLDFPAVPVHWHEEMELIVVKKGRGIIIVDRKPYEVRAGELMVVLPGQLHGIRRRRQEEMEYENIIFLPKMLMNPGEDLCTAQFLVPLFGEETASPILVAEGTKEQAAFLRCVEELDGLSRERPYGYELAVKGKLYELLYLVLTVRRPIRAERPGKSREKIKALLEYVEEHYGERVTVEDGAAVCYYSQSHFMKYFRQYMGMSFVTYLNDYRLTRAAGFLIEGEETVTAVAQRCGFDNLSYFNRLFRRKYGMTPGEYRSCRHPSETGKLLVPGDEIC